MKISSALQVVVVALGSLDLLVSAFVYPSAPIGATVWKPESTVTISWTEDKVAPLLSSNPVFDIFLMTGADDRQIKLAKIASNVKGGTTNSVKYVVPHVSPPGQIYFLMFVTKDGTGMAWATRFTITDEKGGHGSLHPVIPPGGKINPGGVGAIVSSPQKAAPQNKGGKGAEEKEAAKAPAKSPANTHAKAAAAEDDTPAKVPETKSKTSTQAKERQAAHPDMDASSAKGKGAVNGGQALTPWIPLMTMMVTIQVLAAMTMAYSL
ncbi:hypothetical protein BG004_003990 [Podila humilis]|nr:hypothetical protein BG004_003990 [Podila humilis]